MKEINWGEPAYKPDEDDFEECDHKWKYLGSNRNGSYYRCTKCGLEEEG